MTGNKEVYPEQPLKVRLQYWATRLVSAVREGWYRGVRMPLDQLIWLLWARGLGVPIDGLSRRNAFSSLGETTELWVDPLAVERIISVKEAGFPKRDFISNRDWDLRDRDISENERFVMLADLWEHRSELERSATFKEYQRRALEGRPAHVVTKSIYLDTDRAVLDYLVDQVVLLDSVKDKGVIKGATSDDIKVAVDRSGRLIKANGGRKRTAAAIIVGAPALPVRICHVHQQYLDDFFAENMGRSEALRWALEAVRQRYSIEHRP